MSLAKNSDSVGISRAIILIALVLLLVAVVAVLFSPRTVIQATPLITLCSDGTLEGDCSLAKPFFCFNGWLLERPGVCGCPVGFSYVDEACSQLVTCSDGTLSPGCSESKPLQCVNGTLAYRASVCGCPDGMLPEGERCVTRQPEREFLSKLWWDHMPVSFSIDEASCGPYESRKVRKAFAELVTATGSSVNFTEISSSADISVSCTFLENCYELSTDIRGYTTYRYERICSHSKGITNYSYVGSVIRSADILMVGLSGFSETGGKGPSGFYVGSCGHTTTELHEILHAFGYDHSESNISIMYYAEDSIGLTLQKPGACIGSDKPIDEEILLDFKARYG